MAKGDMHGKGGGMHGEREVSVVGSMYGRGHAWWGCAWQGAW